MYIYIYNKIILRIFKHASIVYCFTDPSDPSAEKKNRKSSSSIPTTESRSKRSWGFSAMMAITMPFDTLNLEKCPTCCRVALERGLNPLHLLAILRLLVYRGRRWIHLTFITLDLIVRFTREEREIKSTHIDPAPPYHIADVIKVLNNSYISY